MSGPAGQATPSPAELSRVVSHALRHQPWLYELELDEEGWSPLGVLLSALHTVGPGWRGVTRADLADMVATSDKRRHEIDGDRIRALYGHSLPGRILMVETPPPQTLYHGTSPQAWASISEHGLRPMTRQYVHLSNDLDTATAVGRRKSPEPVVLAVAARRGAAEGVRFFRGNEVVWLALDVPSRFVGVAPVTSA